MTLVQFKVKGLLELLINFQKNENESVGVLMYIGNITSSDDNTL